MTFVDLKEIRVSYDGKQDILKDLSISMEKGELVSLLGQVVVGRQPRFSDRRINQAK